MMSKELMSDEEFDAWMAETDRKLDDIKKVTDEELKAAGHHPVYSLLDDITLETEKLKNE
jgi:hypothetical protein